MSNCTDGWKPGYAVITDCFGPVVIGTSCGGPFVDGGNVGLCAAKDGYTLRFVDDDGVTLCAAKDGLSSLDKLHEQVAALRDENDRVKQLAAMLIKHLHPALMADEKSEDPVDAVIRNVLGGKVPAKKVDELHAATGKSKSDRALGRAIGASRMQLGLVTEP